MKAAAWAAALLALSALTLLVPSQPGYDAWAWLVWGRELAALDLDTVQGPAFKPLPVAVTALASGLGDGAPALWLAIARAGALAAVALAARLAWRLGGGSWPAAAVAGAGVALSAGWWWHAAVGNAEGLFLALVLAALHQELDRRHGRVLALGFTASLLRPEAWPFLGVYGVWRWWRDPALRPWLAAAAAALPVLWLGPELVGSGDLMRSSQRAQIPNPGAPALAPRPALESLARAAAIPLAPVALASVALVVAAVGRPRLRLAALPGALGLAWLGVVAAMAELGYSGEPRYALPGAAALAISAGVALALVRERAPALTVAALALAIPFAVVRADGIVGELRRADDAARLHGTLAAAVVRAGGRERLRACGPAVTGPYRGPALAWALGVHRRRIGFVVVPEAVVFRSRIRAGAAVQPPARASMPVLGRSARWEIRGHCGAAPRSSSRSALPYARYPALLARGMPQTTRVPSTSSSPSFGVRAP